MDLQGSLVDTKLKIYPTKALLEFIAKTPTECKTTINITKIIQDNYDIKEQNHEIESIKQVELNGKDKNNLNRIKEFIQKNKKDLKETDQEINIENEQEPDDNIEDTQILAHAGVSMQNKRGEENSLEYDLKVYEPHLSTLDIDWLYNYIQKLKASGELEVPYLHTLLEGARIEMPKNQLIKRNPILEARCKQLRPQQEARDYRKMTKSVDNVRMVFPDDSISYQMKQVNRQLIAVGQLIISIFAGFLFGFKGIEWMIGSFDFGIRLLFGVMCALIIMLAEVYFLSKQLNEDLYIPETIQLGGPPKFVDQTSLLDNSFGKVPDVGKKEHQD